MGICTGVILGSGRIVLVVVGFLNWLSPSSSEEEVRGDGNCCGGVCLSIEVGALIFRPERPIDCERSASLFGTCERIGPSLSVCGRNASLSGICVRIDSSLFVRPSDVIL